jgi:hypothetical protein
MPTPFLDDAFGNERIDFRERDHNDPFNAHLPRMAETRVPGVDEAIVFRGRIGMEDVRRFIERQLRLFYDQHGHGRVVSVETRPWLGQNIIDDEWRGQLPTNGALRPTYDMVREHEGTRAVLVQRAGEFAVNLITSGRSDANSHYEREEIVTRIFDVTILKDALSGFMGPFENTMREYWILSRDWTRRGDTKYDHTTGQYLSMESFYQRWLISRDMAVWKAEQRLASRTAASVAQLLNDLNR